ncbi:hypothetical protein B7463_g10280, partial [Scytalidium lignicola]
MADYTQYATVAPEWLEFEKTWSPPAPDPSLSLSEARDRANAGTAKLLNSILGSPEGIEVSEHTVPTSDGSSIPVRLYKPGNASSKLPLYVHFHAGGYYLGNLETDAPACLRIVLNTGAAAVLSVNYRHTPEWTFPAPVNDVWNAFNWIYTSADDLGINREKIVVGGSSAGATLVITVALRDLKQNGNRIKGLILSIPATVHPDHFPRGLVKDGFSSLEQNADAPFINLQKFRFFASLYKPDPTHPDCSPLLLPDESFRGFPPTCVHVAGRDPIRDEGLLFEEKLVRAGVNTKLHIYPGLPHGFMSFPTLPSSKKWSTTVQGELKGFFNA